jgi:hypothetical protein
MRRVPLTCTFGVVATDTKRAAFQQLQGYITTPSNPYPVATKCSSLASRTRTSSSQHFVSNSINRRSRPVAHVLQMAEHSSSTPAVRSWKSLSGQEVRQRLTSLGFILDIREKVIICTKCQYALKPSNAVSKNLGDKHDISAKACHGLNAFVRANKLEPRPDGRALHPCLATKPGMACVQYTYLLVCWLGTHATAPCELMIKKWP